MVVHSIITQLTFICIAVITVVSIIENSWKLKKNYDWDKKKSLRSKDINGWSWIVSEKPVIFFYLTTPNAHLTYNIQKHHQKLFKANRQNIYFTRSWSVMSWILNHEVLAKIFRTAHIYSTITFFRQPPVKKPLATTISSPPRCKDWILIPSNFITEVLGVKTFMIYSPLSLQHRWSISM